MNTRKLLALAVLLILGLAVNGGRFPHKSGVHRRHGTA